MGMYTMDNEIVIFFRGSTETEVSVRDIKSNDYHVLDSLCRKFGTERVNRMREVETLEDKLNILAEDFCGWKFKLGGI